MKLDPFYLIVDSADWIERLIPLGVKLVQLRMKDVSESEINDHIQRSKVVCEKHGCQLIINDFWQAAIDNQCDYIHLGQGDLDDADIDAIRSAGLKLGISTHTHEELDRALSFEPDYVALGPIYETILKKMVFAPQGLEKITEWKGIIGDLPLIAIGGLNIDRLPGVFAAKADVACVVTDIIMNEDPEARTLAWIKATAGQRV